MWLDWLIVDCFIVVVVVSVNSNGCRWFVECLWLHGLGWSTVNGYMYIWAPDVFGYELLFLVAWFVDSFCFGPGCVVGSGWAFVVKMARISLMFLRSRGLYIFMWLVVSGDLLVWYSIIPWINAVYDYLFMKFKECCIATNMIGIQFEIYWTP